MSNAKRFVEMGFPAPAAVEIAKQIDAGTGNASRLQALGIEPLLAKGLATLFSGGSVPATKLVALGLPPLLAVEVVKQKGGGGGSPAPSWSVQPSISGTPQVGQTLTGNVGTISNGSVSARSWLRNGTAISGATGGTYLLQAADEGAQVAFRVSASGPGGTANATSAAVTVTGEEPGPVYLINAPILSLATAPGVYPPEVEILVDPTVNLETTHHLRLQVQTVGGDWSTLLIDSTTLLANTGEVDVGLSAVTPQDGEVEIRAWIVRADGQQSPFSEVLVAGVPYEPSAGRAVFLTIGDSIVAGRGNPESSRNTATDPYPIATQYVFDASSPDYQTVQPVTGPIAFSTAANDHNRVSNAVERLLIDYRNDSGLEVGVIPASLGGSSLASGWNSSTPGASLVAAVAAVNDAMPKFRAQGAARLAGVVISLGSNDVANQSTLVTRWLGLLDYLRTNCPDIDDSTPIIITGGVEPALGDGAATRGASEVAASQRINVFPLHPPVPTASADNLHPTLSEGRTWGAGLAALFRTVETTGQPIPTFTLNGAQGSAQGEALSINITHTGLTAASKYGVVEIAPGSDAAQFALGGTFHAPTLTWTGGGTGPDQGDYVVNLRLRNGAWDYGTPFPVTVTVAAPTVGPITVSHLAQYEVPSAYQTTTVSDVPVKKGMNYFLFMNDGGGDRSSYFAATVDGNPVRREAFGAYLEMWSFYSAIDTTVTVGFSWGPLSASWRMGVTNVANVEPTPAASAITPWQQLQSPYALNNITAPADGIILTLVFVASSSGVFAAGEGTALVGQGNAGIRQYLTFTRDTSGTTNFTGPNGYLGGATVALNKAA